MNRFMRDELLVESNAHNVFALLASRSIEIHLPPLAVPPTLDDDDNSDVYYENGRWVVDTRHFGLRVEIPQDAIIDGARLSIRTLAPSAVTYLEASNEAEFAFSPCVRIDYPAFEAGEEEDMLELGAARAPPFKTPLTLVMPHCFDPSEAEASCVMLGAPHGAERWEKVHAVDDGADLSRDDLFFDGAELRASIPYAGIFCGFSSPDLEDVAAVRFFVFAMPELPRDDPSSLRIHLCPELPDQIAEMELSESSEWGTSQRIGMSKVLYLCQGATFRLKYEDDRTGAYQDGTLAWHGVRVSAEFTIPISGDRGEPPADCAADDREILRDSITADVIEGQGQRAARPVVVAKRAGIPENGFEIPFATFLKNEVRPNAPVLVLKERTPYDFSVVWRKPTAIDGDGDGDVAEITHYSLELATCAPCGTYYPWRELWSGAGHVTPDFAALAREEMAAKGGREEDVRAAQAETRTRQARLEQEIEKAEAEVAGAAAAAESASGGAASGKRSRRAKKKAAKPAPKTDAAASAAEVAETYTYGLPVEPHLFGRLRLRCWSEGECRPSKYSNVVKLPRWGGVAEEGQMDPAQRLIVSMRREYFGSRRQHVTEDDEGQGGGGGHGGGGAVAIGVGHRIGNRASGNAWGGDTMPPPPPLRSVKEIAMARVPYDMPLLPSAHIPGLEAAAAALAAFYREVGVEGGGGGLLLGLSIDHVLHAIMGSPTTEYRYSPRRTVSTLQQPLIAFCEVAYHDVLLPLLDTVCVVRGEWQYVDEKVAGIVAQLVTHRRHYDFIQTHLKEILGCMLELHEIMCHCQPEHAIAFHLTNPTYAHAVKRALRQELTAALCQQLWKLSIELLEMQLDLRDHVQQRACGCAPLAEWVSPQMKCLWVHARAPKPRVLLPQPAEIAAAAPPATPPVPPVTSPAPSDTTEVAPYLPEIIPPEPAVVIPQFIRTYAPLARSPSSACTVLWELRLPATDLVASPQPSTCSADPSAWLRGWPTTPFPPPEPRQSAAQNARARLLNDARQSALFDARVRTGFCGSSPCDTGNAAAADMRLTPRSMTRALARMREHERLRDAQASMLRRRVAREKVTDDASWRAAVLKLKRCSGVHRPGMPSNPRVSSKARSSGLLATENAPTAMPTAGTRAIERGLRGGREPASRRPASGRDGSSRGVLVSPPVPALRPTHSAPSLRPNAKPITQVEVRVRHRD